MILSLSSQGLESQKLMVFADFCMLGAPSTALGYEKGVSALLKKKQPNLDRSVRTVLPDNILFHTCHPCSANFLLNMGSFAFCN